jgi:drug/metabolite transporter (DMT)-like permease
MSLLEDKKHLIYILGTFAFFLFTIADTFIKLIGDLYKDTIIFSIACFSAVIPVLIYLIYRKSLQEIKTKNYKLHFVRGILMTLTYYFIVKGIILLPLSIAYPIILSAPVLLSVMGIILKETIYLSKIISLVLQCLQYF